MLLCICYKARRRFCSTESGSTTVQTTYRYAFCMFRCMGALVKYDGTLRVQVVILSVSVLVMMKLIDSCGVGPDSVPVPVVHAPHRRFLSITVDLSVGRYKSHCL
jgi:hypothetical protein